MKDNGSVRSLFERIEPYKFSIMVNKNNIVFVGIRRINRGRPYITKYNFKGKRST